MGSSVAALDALEESSPPARMAFDALRTAASSSDTDAQPLTRATIPTPAATDFRTAVFVIPNLPRDAFVAGRRPREDEHNVLESRGCGLSFRISVPDVGR